MNNIQPIWLRFGFFYALTSIVILIVSFYIVSIGVWYQILLSLLIMVVFMVMGGKAVIKAQGEVLLYGEGLKTTFLIGLMGMVISTLFSLIMMHLVDPSLVDKLTEQIVEASSSLMESLGVPEDQIEEAVEMAEEEASKGFTPMGQLFQLLQSTIFVVIVAAFVSIFIKKDEDIHNINIKAMGNQS